jgi:DNA repair protein RecN (Recombination protein N)
MLRTVRVRDLALIEELELALEPGLNVITGETGAGKSILLQALDVALGGRPDADLVRTGAEEAAVEVLFANVPAEVRERLAGAGISTEDPQDELLVRRVIARGGRTRAYVNGALGSLALLRELAPHLLRVYGQDEHQALRRVESHRELLDAVGGLGRTLEEMRARHGRLVAARQAIVAAHADTEAARERAEMLRAQAEELVRAALVPGEEEALGAERARLVHAERLAVLATGAEEGIYSGEGAVIEVLGRALVALREAAGLDASLEPVRALLESSLAELEEAGQSLGRYARELTPDASRLEAVEERLAQLARLKRKFAGTVEDLIRRRDELMAEADSVAGGGEAMVELEAAAEAARRAAAEWAGRLSVERRREARDLSRALVAELEALALTGARFEARFAESEGRALGPEGWDEVEFFLSTNPGEEPRSLARVASGGELSRIMLALKTLAAADERGATLIFDEVDAGIGGAVAEVVGRKLRQLGRSRQVLCITHLPLIAAFAEHHVVVTKKVEKERTVSTARPLAPTERVAELARMLGGERLTHEVREHAEQLLRRAQRPQSGIDSQQRGRVAG